MIELNILLSSVMEHAIAALRKERADVYTFSLVHERDKGAVSVYADEEANSRRVVRRLNRTSMRNFAKAVQRRDLDEALMWQAMVGRSLSTRDFSWKKLARRSLGGLKHAPELHEALLLAGMKYASEVAELSSDRESLLFTCSTADDEVGLIWSVDAATSQNRDGFQSVARNRRTGMNKRAGTGHSR